MIAALRPKPKVTEAYEAAQKGLPLKTVMFDEKTGNR
jgi:hypothetical protein